jgi:hypothetical protein
MSERIDLAEELATFSQYLSPRVSAWKQRSPYLKGVS